MSNQQDIIQNFLETTNPENWGLNDEDLNIEII